MAFIHRPGRAFWLAAAATILLVPCAGAAERLPTADFDGDGRHDRIAIDGEDPSLLHVWLSATGASELIRSARPLLRVAAIDLDGDHRPELIATDVSTSGLRVWTKRGRLAFRPYRPGHPVSRDVLYRGGRTVDDDSADSLVGLPGSPYLEKSLISSRAPHAASIELVTRSTPPNRTFTSSARLASIAPRPPPVLFV
jgi:hypothetical protein